MRVRTVALLLTDVVGSTRLWRDAPESMNAAMIRHHELVAAAAADYGGWRPVDQGEGDATFMAFDSAVDAVAAALDLQRALIAEPWPTPVPLAVRIGIHVGEVITRDGNIFGETVSRCARIRGVAHGGQTLLSTAAYELVRDSLPSRATLLSLGEHRMKDLIRPEGIWQLDHPELPGDFPPLASLNRGRHNLPVQLTSFVGRETEQADVTRLLAGDARLVTVSGFGGMGKTRLALSVAAGLVDGAGDGVWFVDLSGTTDAGAVPREVAAVVGVRDDGQGFEEAVVEHLADKRLLLVLDNLEQVLDCAPFVARLLATGPDLRVLITSRVPIGLRGEMVYALQPLATPSRGRVDANEAGTSRLSTYDAVTLFIDRARAVRHDFAVDDDNAAAVAAICAQLDGVPLAIELAAARVSLLTPTTLLERLQSSVGGLRAAELDRPERHRTVRATVKWSFDLLDDVEQALLTRLSVFPGTAGLAAVEAVCAASEGAGTDALAVLESLVARSLVRPTEEDGEPRFSLLVSVREFAAARLSPAERRALSDAHLDYFLHRSVVGAATGDGPDEQPWFTELTRDEHNFRAALDHAVASGRVRERLLLATNLFELWLHRGFQVEGEGHIARARAVAGDLPDDLALAAFAAGAQAWLSVARNADSTDLGEASIALAERSGDPNVIAWAFQVAGSTRRDREAAREAHERAIEAARAARSVASPVRWGSSRPDAVEIGASMWLITYHRWTDPAEALRHGTALRARALEAGRPADVGHIDARLGDLASDAGDTDAATMLYDRAIELATRRHDDLHRAHVTLTRAIALVRAGREPLDVIPALIARHREFARATVVAAAELVLGDGLAVSGRWSDAEHAYQRALSLVRVPAAARWRLLRGERVRGRDTRGELEGVFRADRDNWWWDRPDVLGFLVEAAATAEQYGQLDRASRLIAAVVGMRRTFALPTVIAADLAELEQRYRAEPARSALPDHLFNR